MLALMIEPTKTPKAATLVWAKFLGEISMPMMAWTAVWRESRY